MNFAEYAVIKHKNTMTEKGKFFQNYVQVMAMKSLYIGQPSMIVKLKQVQKPSNQVKSHLKWKHACEIDHCRNLVAGQVHVSE